MSPSQNIPSVSNNANGSDCAVDGASNSTQLPSEQLGNENEVCSVDTSPLDERQTPDYESASMRVILIALLIWALMMTF